MSKPTPKKPSAQKIVQIELPAKPRKHPRQDRSVALVDALKKTGREILERDGRDALSLEQLSLRSGVAVSSIYEYFPTMESLIAEIFEEYRGEARQQVLDGLQALPPTATLYDGIELILKIGISLLHKWRQFDPEFFTRSAHYEELVRLALVKPEHAWPSVATNALMERFPDEVRVHNREKARFLVFQTILALPRAMVLMKPEYLGEEDTQVLLARMLHAVLTTDV